MSETTATAIRTDVLHTVPQNLRCLKPPEKLTAYRFRVEDQGSKHSKVQGPTSHVKHCESHSHVNTAKP